jgi:CRP-like cAMP-binding protein
MTLNGSQNTQSRNLPSTADVEYFAGVLGFFYPLSDGVKNFFATHGFICNISKKKLLLKSGALCEHVYFIKEGALRGFIKEGAKDITTWITVENEMVTSIASLDNRDPSVENIQAIEDCKMLAISYENLEELYSKFPEFNIVTRKILQRYYRDAEGRAFIARLTKAENKYQYFLDKHANLINRIPLKYIASFLGITQETLSRVRKKFKSREITH